MHSICWKNDHQKDLHIKNENVCNNSKNRGIILVFEKQLHNMMKVIPNEWMHYCRVFCEIIHNIKPYNQREFI